MARTRKAGWRAAESNVSFFGNEVDVVRIHIPHAWTLTALKVASQAISGAKNVKPVVYNDSSGAPGSLAYSGSQTAIPDGASDGDFHTVFTGSQNFAAGSYWIGVHVETAFGGKYQNDTGSNKSYFVSATYASGPPDPFGAGSADTRPFTIYAEYQLQTETDDDTIAGSYAGDDTGGADYLGGNNENNARKFTVPADGDITKVLVDLGDLDWANGAQLKPAIWSDSANSPNTLLKSGAEVVCGPGHMDLPLSTVLAVSQNDVIWVGYIQEFTIELQDTDTSETTAYGSGTYSAGPTDPFASPNIAARDMAIGYSLDTGGGGGSGGGPGGDQPGTIRLFPTGLLRSFPVNSRHDDFLT